MFDVVEHTAEPMEGIINWQVNNVSSMHRVIRDEVAILELARDWHSIPWEGKQRRSEEVMELMRAAGAFVDVYYQTGRCFKGVDMMIRGTENLVPTLVNPTTVPVTKGSSKFVGHAVSKSCLQKKNKLVPDRVGRVDLVGILKGQGTLAGVGILGIGYPFG